MGDRPLARRSDAYWVLVPIVMFLVAAVIVGATTTVPTTHLTDNLGPTSGEPVVQYLDSARKTLADNDSDSMRWALVSFATEQDAAATTAIMGRIPVHRLIFHVPVVGQQTPVISMGVAGGPPAYGTAFRRAASVVDTSGPGADAALADRVQRSLRGGCACVVAAVVRAPLNDLRALAGNRPVVRAIEAAPADSGSVTATPLLPQYIDTVGPVAFGRPDR